MINFRNSRFKMRTAALVMSTMVSVFMSTRESYSAEIYKLSQNQRISCNRSLTSGKLQNIACKSFAYVLNSITSEFYRCQVSVAVVRDTNAVLKTEADGKCTSLGRIFSADSSYSFDATETEPPNTNSFFGSGGTAIWVSDNHSPKVRGCIRLVPGVGADLQNCVDMTFEPQN